MSKQGQKGSGHPADSMGRKLQRLLERVFPARGPGVLDQILNALARLRADVQGNAKAIEALAEKMETKPNNNRPPQGATTVHGTRESNMLKFSKDQVEAANDDGQVTGYRIEAKALANHPQKAEILSALGVREADLNALKEGDLVRVNDGLLKAVTSYNRRWYVWAGIGAAGLAVGAALGAAGMHYFGGASAEVDGAIPLRANG